MAMLKEASEELAKKVFSFGFETFGEMESTLELIFSPPGASVILHMAALKCGVHSYRRLKRKAGTKEEALNYLSELKNKENWGKLSFQDVDFVNGSGRIVIFDSFETVARKGRKARKSGDPCCHFFRGFLAGFLSEMFRKPITVNEEKCVGKGDKHCEFVFE